VCTVLATIESGFVLLIFIIVASAVVPITVSSERKVGRIRFRRIVVINIIILTIIVVSAIVHSGQAAK
jgi:hypothetical protein